MQTMIMNTAIMNTAIRNTAGLGLLLRMHADLLAAASLILFSLVAGSWLAGALLY